ncbi:unnamed protein product [Laminaria digitata]
MTPLRLAACGRSRASGIRVVCVGFFAVLQGQGFSVLPGFGTRRTTATMATEGPRFTVDSHLHVWGDGRAPFPYAEGQEPPERLRESSNPEVLCREMDKAGVGGALIVQV